MTNRLKVFRSHMAALDAAGPPEQALARGVYVPRTGGGTAMELATRVALRRGALHLLWGGIGSGKTTEMLFACNTLNGTEETWADYVDVADPTGSGQGPNGSLIEPVLLAVKARHRLEKGSVDVRVAGTGGVKLATTDSADSVDATHRKRHRILEEMTNMFDKLASGAPHKVLFLDSLDRLWDMSVFERIVREDLPVLQQAGLSVVVAGPLRSMYGAARPLADLFDSVHHQSYVDVEHDLEGVHFLVDVVRRRLSAQIIPNDTVEALVSCSGGVLRDLLQLTEIAFEEAYLGGADTVRPEDVRRAADTFGRKLLLGLESNQTDQLRKVGDTGRFVPVTDNDVALVLSRRILAYDRPVPRYAVHPTIAPLLQALAA